MKLPINPQVVGGWRTMPIGAGIVPLHDVFGFGPEIPYSIDGWIDGGFYGDGMHVEEFDAGKVINSIKWQYLVDTLKLYE